MSRSVEAALARIARDGHAGRVPTFGHPACSCLHEHLMLAWCPDCRAGADEPCRPTRAEADLAGPWLHAARRTDSGRPWLLASTYYGAHDDCPVHGRPERAGRHHTIAPIPPRAPRRTRTRT